MPDFNAQWKVLPHGPVTKVDDRIAMVEGELKMPLARFPRRMTVVGLSGNRSAIFSAMALGEEAMAQVCDIGVPSFLIVPNGHHRLDARPWKQRFPEIKVLAPRGARDRVREAVPVDATDDILNDRTARFVVLAGTDEGEAALVVERQAGVTIIVNDVIANVRHPQGLGANIVARLGGFGVRRPQVPRIVRRMLVTDRKALAGQFASWSELPNVRRIVPSHGVIIEDPAPILRRLSEDLR